MAGAELTPIAVDDVKYWVHGEVPSRPKPSALLLPNYDEFFIGYRDRSAIGLRLKSARMVTGGSALVAYVIAVDGQLVGAWKRSLGRDAIKLDVNLLDRLTSAEEKRVLAEVRRFETFAGRAVDLRGLGPRRSARTAR